MHVHLPALPRIRGMLYICWIGARGFVQNHIFHQRHAHHVGKIGKLIETLTFSPLDSVVIMTHDFQRDIDILRRLKEEELFYLGILGSKNRTERLLGGLIPNWIHSPVGLSIGADGPEEIAVSIVAELIAKKGGEKMKVVGIYLAAGTAAEWEKTN